MFNSQALGLHRRKLFSSIPSDGKKPPTSASINSNNVVAEIVHTDPKNWRVFGNSKGVGVLKSWNFKRNVWYKFKFLELGDQGGGGLNQIFSPWEGYGYFIVDNCKSISHDL